MPDRNDTSTPYPPGTWLRCDADGGGLPDDGGILTGKGVEFEVEAYVAADDADNDAGGIAYYIGSSDGSAGDVACAVSVATLVRTAEEQANRAIPSLADVTTALASAAIDMEGRAPVQGAAGFEADETNTYGKPETGVFEVYGETDDGLRFGVEVEVKRVWRTDA